MGITNRERKYGISRRSFARGRREHRKRGRLQWRLYIQRSCQKSCFLRISIRRVRRDHRKNPQMDLKCKCQQTIAIDSLCRNATCSKSNSNVFLLYKPRNTSQIIIDKSISKSRSGQTHNFEEINRTALRRALKATSFQRVIRGLRILAADLIDSACDRLQQLTKIPTTE